MGNGSAVAASSFGPDNAPLLVSDAAMGRSREADRFYGGATGNYSLGDGEALRILWPPGMPIGPGIFAEDRGLWIPGGLGGISRDLLTGNARERVDGIAQPRPVSGHQTEQPDTASINDGFGVQLAAANQRALGERSRLVEALRAHRSPDQQQQEDVNA